MLNTTGLNDFNCIFSIKNFTFIYTIYVVYYTLKQIFYVSVFTVSVIGPRGFKLGKSYGMVKNMVKIEWFLVFTKLE